MIRRLHSQQIWATGALCKAAFALLRFPLPDLGEKIKEGRVRKIYVKEGARVKEFEKLADVESDKQFTEITAPEEGIVRKLHYQENQSCQVGDIFLDLEIEDKEETPSTTTNVAAPPAVSVPNPKSTVVQPISSPVVTPVPTKYEVLASATVHLLAKQHKISLESLTGTGKKGRILKDDIIYELERRQNQPAASTSSQRVAISKDWLSLVNASNNIPHLQLTETFDLTQALQFQSPIYSPTISSLSVLIKTFSLALTEHSRINSTYNANEPFKFQTHPSHRLLLSLPEGYKLLQNIQNQSLFSIQKLIQATSLLPELNEQYAANATVAISHDSDGGLSVNPLILGQLVCHANIGRIREIVTLKGGAIQRKQVTDITLGCDHRVLDGASVARFASTWRQLSENPYLAFLRMI